MTTRFALLLVGALAFTYIGCERNSASTQGTVKPLLWSVTKDGKTSHLFGTMHDGVDPAQLPTVVWATLDAATTVAFETDMSKVGPLLMRGDGKTLHEELGPLYWKKLEKLVGAETAATLDPLKPWAAAGLVAMHAMPKTASIDDTLEQRAHARGKSVRYLETAESQAAVLDRWLDLRTLKEMLDDADAIAATNKQMPAAYANGDEADVLAVSEQDRARWIAHGRTSAEYDEAMADILYRRNASWVPSIEAMHAAGGAFIAVGALHLCGPKSVVELLRERGYNVTRITR